MSSNHTERLCPVCGGVAHLACRGTTTPLGSLGAHGYRIAEGQLREIPTVWQCAACGLGFVPERPEPAQLAEAYRRSEPDAAYLAERAGRERTADRVLKQLERYARPPGRLLDVGSGPGFFLSAARARGWEITGIEPAAWARVEAERILGPRVIHDGGAEDFRAVAGQVFDVVTSLDVIEHVVDPRRLLAACTAHIRDGGMVVLTTPRYDSVAARLLRGRWPSILPAHLWYFTRPALSRLLVEVGLDVLAFRDHVRFFGVRYLARRAVAVVASASCAQRRASRATQLLVPVTLRDAWEVYARKPSFGSGVNPTWPAQPLQR